MYKPCCLLWFGDEPSSVSGLVGRLVGLNTNFKTSNHTAELLAGLSCCINRRKHFYFYNMSRFLYQKCRETSLLGYTLYAGLLQMF